MMVQISQSQDSKLRINCTCLNHFTSTIDIRSWVIFFVLRTGKTIWLNAHKIYDITTHNQMLYTN